MIASSEVLRGVGVISSQVFRFGTTWRGVNDDNIFIFWVNYPFNLARMCVYTSKLKKYKIAVLT